MAATREEASTREEFAQATQLAASGETEKAVALYQGFVRAHPFSSKAEEAQFQLARLLQQEGKDTASFKAYTNLLKKYPETPHFEEAVAEQITIANAYLRGKRVKLCGIPAFSVVERAQEMYENILMMAPYSKYAALTQFNLGLSLERQGKNMEAIAAYQKLIDKYPTSSICDNALYQIGYAYMSLGMIGKSQDLSALKEAQHSFDDYLIQYPNSDKSLQASDNIAAMQHREALDTLRIARFYDFSKNYRASSVYYNEVIRQFPQSKDAAISKARLAEIKNEVGEEALRPGALPLSGPQAAANRRLQAQVETTSLSNYDGPPKKEIAPNDHSPSLPEMRTNIKEVQPAP
ncbi:MAG: outer membrane protein assembly factor BamD [Chthoniobacterales bacterium]|nr:outer membrane protein assembly factor BamD [Chthoniobacterales bacterium]